MLDNSLSYRDGWVQRNYVLLSTIDVDGEGVDGFEREEEAGADRSSIDGLVTGAVAILDTQDN